MFLKSLVVRGFKSFADKTALVFEPGTTVVVGPNGSGKSNVVDAISWVLGEQGPRALRGGKMEDVIFAGSRLRPALGMAEVALTIDNSAGLLPIEFGEVTISRTLFRSGESEYRINGAPCRLLDIQEILSDTGIGREQHTIVGQGQLDAVLSAGPGEMRAFVEEAAGIAKHRRRRERSLRRIAGAEQNLVRLGDLLSEVRRQLRPLREQAEVARRHAQLTEELSRIRLVLASRELAAVRVRLGPGAADLEGPIRRGEEELAAVEAALADAERVRDEAIAGSEAGREAVWRLQRAAERLASLSRLSSEREGTLSARLASVTEAAARADAERLERERGELADELAGTRDREAAAAAVEAAHREELAAADAALAEREGRLGPLRAAHRERAGETVRVRGEIAAQEAALRSAQAERERSAARRRSGAAAGERAALALEEERRRLEELEAQEAPLVEDVGRLEEEVERLEAERRQALHRARALDREAAAWRARAGAGPSPEAARRLAASGGDGVAGVLADLVDGLPEHVRALEALVGGASGVLVLTGAGSVAGLLGEAGDEEGVGFLVAGPPGPHVPGARPFSELLRVGHPAAEAALSSVYLVEDADPALLAAEHPHGIFVSPRGVVAVGRLVARGPGDAAGRAAAAEADLAAAERVVAELERAAADTARRRDAAAARLNEADAALAGAADRLAHLEREVHALDREAEATAEAEEQAAASAAAIAERLQALRASLPGIEAAVEEASREMERAQEEQAQVAGVRGQAGSHLQEARLELARASERRRLVEDRLAAVGAAIERAAREAAGAEGRRAALAAGVERARRAGEAALAAAELARSWAGEAEERLASFRGRAEESGAGVAMLRARRAEAAAALDALRRRAREEDLERSELRIRSRILEERLREEWRTEPGEAVERYGVRWDLEDESRLADPMDRAALQDGDALNRRRARLERDLESMGRVNPLAAQEFEALAEREEFLARQMADLRASRRDLLKVVAEVDGRIRELFRSAFEDVAREYERLFAMLFPGGQGRLRLTDPSDMLATGVEVEARPGGKNLRRLSLLSGGERALAALAVLFAIFRARPSPFYVLDEVEAALDDINLHRFIGLLQEFKETSQLLVVTHQKRTMEAADVLYGVSIRSDGASRVVSQRLADPAAAPDAVR